MQVTKLTLLQKQRTLAITFDNGEQYELPCEYLRVYSPSAEVRGHGGQSSVLQTGKKNVNIIGIDPVGNYAVKLIFDDGHNTGLYSWDVLYDLATHHAKYWEDYLTRLKNNGSSREA